MLKRLVSGLSAMAMLAGSCPAWAADYPTQPITVLIPTRPGGATDVGVRTWMPFLDKCLGGGATSVALNVTGAGGALMFAQLAAAAPDGHTIGVLLMPNFSTSIVSSPENRYNVEDFDFLGNLYGNVIALGVSNTSPIKTIEELMDKAKAGPVNVSVGGIGNEEFLMLKGINREEGTQFVPIPFDGSSPAIASLLGGHVDAGAFSVTNVLTQEGKLVPLAIGAPQDRVPELPDLPTFKEKGIDAVATSTHTIAAPAGLPADVKAKLTGCFDSIAKDPEFLAEAKKRSMRMQPMSADDTAAHVKSETDHFKEIWAADPWL